MSEDFDYIGILKFGEITEKISFILNISLPAINRMIKVNNVRLTSVRSESVERVRKRIFAKRTFKLFLIVDELNGKYSNTEIIKGLNHPTIEYQLRKMSVIEAIQEDTPIHYTVLIQRTTEGILWHKKKLEIRNKKIRETIIDALTTKRGIYE